MQRKIETMEGEVKVPWPYRAGGGNKKEIKTKIRKMRWDRQYKLALSNVPVTITSLASTCGLFKGGN